MTTRLFAAQLFLFLFASSAHTQSVKVDTQNRMIEIVAESSITVTADRVAITVGYRNYGPTHDEAFAENARVAARIFQDWKDAGVPEQAISTQDLTSKLTPEDEMRQLMPAERKEKKYQVAQSWRITEDPQKAEKLLDIAVDAGANEVGSPGWTLADSSVAEAQAYTAALGQAHAIADQLAKSFGGKVGALLYASNQARPVDFGMAGGTAGGVLGGVIGSPAKSRPDTKLLPQKIETSGYVRAIFALE